MKVPRFKSVSMRLIEVLVALALVLFAFGAIMVLINTLFPTGSGLIGLLDKDQQTNEHGKRNMVVSVGDYEAGLIDIKGLTAVLDQTKHTVRRKPAEGIAWDKVTAGTPLFDQDAVQTFSGSGANIVFDKNNRLSMGENSLIIVQHLDKDLFRNERRSQVVVVDGELRGTIGGASKEGISVEVATANAVATVSGAGAVAEFSVRVNPDRSSTLTVYSGVAEFTSMGQRVMVEENQSVTARDGEPMRKVEELPLEVQLKGPAQRVSFYYRDISPQIEFTWEKMKRVDRYRLQIARDVEFSQVIVDETLSETAFSLGNLRDGDYYWRVMALHEWAQGAFSKVRTVRVEQDLQPPPLQVTFPEKISASDHITLTGSSEITAQVFVAGQQVALDNSGGFSYGLTLQQGVNVLVVEAVDRVGNVNHKSQMVYGKF